MSAERWRQHYEVHTTETHTPWGMVTRMTVAKRSEKDGITWDKLQEIKNDVLGPDTVCIEVFPAADDLVYEYNRRHLWVWPEAKGPMPFQLEPRYRR